MSYILAEIWLGIMMASALVAVIIFIRNINAERFVILLIFSALFIILLSIPWITYEAYETVVSHDQTEG